jgi:hypothetical protein
MVAVVDMAVVMVADTVVVTDIVKAVTIKTVDALRELDYVVLLGTG